MNEKLISSSSERPPKVALHMRSHIACGAACSPSIWQVRTINHSPV